MKFGAGYIATGFASPLSQIGLSFSSTQSGDPQNTGATGDPLSSFLLNVPSGGSRRNVNETERPGGLLSIFLQDSWKASPRLTVNYGVRYDYPFIPPYGTTATIGQQGGIETGDMDFANGTYILQYLPPPCAVRGHAPCIPGDGTLPDHVVVLPFTHIAHNVHTNWGPRFGFAFKVNEKTVAHGAFGIVFDDWAAVTQMAQNIEGLLARHRAADRTFDDELSHDRESDSHESQRRIRLARVRAASSLPPHHLGATNGSTTRISRTLTRSSGTSAYNGR